jgi:hypothetical protein
MAIVYGFFISHHKETFIQRAKNHLQALKKTFDRGFPENDFADRIMLAVSLHGLYQGCSWWHLEVET